VPRLPLTEMGADAAGGGLPLAELRVIKPFTGPNWPIRSSRPRRGWGPTPPGICVDLLGLTPAEVDHLLMAGALHGPAG